MRLEMVIGVVSPGVARHCRRIAAKVKRSAFSAVAVGGEEWFNASRSGGIAGRPAIEIDPSNLIRLTSA
jgi:hypothetical protein